MADREGFEPSIELPLYTRSRRAPSTTRPPVRLPAPIRRTHFFPRTDAMPEASLCAFNHSATCPSACAHQAHAFLSDVKPRAFIARKSRGLWREARQNARRLAALFRKRASLFPYRVTCLRERGERPCAKGCATPALGFIPGPSGGCHVLRPQSRDASSRR